MADKLFKDYYEERVEQTSLDGNTKILVKTGTGDVEKIDASLLGGSTVLNKTGNNIDFVTNAFWNVSAPLDDDFILDFNNAVLGSCAIVYYQGDNEPEITSSVPITITSGLFSVGKLNTYNYIYNGVSVNCVITADSRPILETPVITASSDSATSLLIGINAVTNATSYDMLIGTVDDVTQATAVSGYNGTDLSYTITGLIEDTLYYVFVIAKANGYYNSPTATTSATPTDVVIPLFSYDFAGTTLDTSKFINDVNNANTSYTQNDKGEFNELATTASSTSQQITTDGLFQFDSSLGDRYFHFDINRLGVTTSFFQIFLGGDNSNVIRIMTGDGESNFVKILNSISGGSVTEDISTDTFQGTFKAALIGGTITLYKWNSTVWTQVAQTTFGNDTYYIRFSKGGQANNGSKTEIDNVYVMDVDTSTQYPVI